VQGTDRSKSFGDVVGAAYGLVNFPIDVLEPVWKPRRSTIREFHLSGGAHIAEVEDRSGLRTVELVSYIAVDDIGT